MSVKYTITPVTRWRIGRTEIGENGAKTIGAETIGEFTDMAAANRVGRVLAAVEGASFESYPPDILMAARDEQLRGALASQFRETRDRAENALDATHLGRVQGLVGGDSAAKPA